MSDNNDFSGPTRNKTHRGPLGLTDAFDAAHSAIRQRIYGIDAEQVKSTLRANGRKVVLLSQMDPKVYDQKYRMGAFGYHGDLYRIVLVVDTKSGKYSHEKIEIPTQNVKWEYKHEYFNSHMMLQFATPFEKRLKLIPIHFRSYGTAVVTENGEIIGWIITADNRQLFARSSDLAQLTKKGFEMFREISERNLELVFDSFGEKTEGEWESFNRIAPETKLKILCGVHGEVLELLGADVPASAISEGLGPLDYIGFGVVLGKLASRLIFVAVTKGTTTLARKTVQLGYRFRLVQPNVYSYGGRKIVVVQTSKGPQPFYKRTGEGGKNPGGAQVGDWAPYDGHMPTSDPKISWMIKESYTKNIAKNDSLFRWGTEEFKAVNDWLKRQKLLTAEVVPDTEWAQLMLYFKKVGVRHRYISTFE